MKKKLFALLMVIMLALGTVPAFADEDFSEAIEEPDMSWGWENQYGINSGDIIHDAKLIPYVKNITADRTIEYSLEIYAAGGEELQASLKRTLEPQDDLRTDESFALKAQELMAGKTLVVREVKYELYDYENPQLPKEEKLTFVLEEDTQALSADQISELEEAEQKMAALLAEIDAEPLRVRIADPQVFAEEGWTQAEAYSIARDVELKLSRDINTIESPSAHSSYTFMPRYYADQELTQELAYGELEPGKTCYVVIEYLGSFTWPGSEGYGRSVITSGEPLEFSYQLVPVEPDSAEVRQIKANNESTDPILVSYSDLAWINVVGFLGYKPVVPAVSNVNSLLAGRDEELYNELIAESSLKLVMIPEAIGEGDAADFSGAIVGSTYYYVDDVFYRPGNTGYIHMANFAYVVEGSSDRAAALEKRVKDYMDDEQYDISVSAMSRQELTDYVLEKCREKYYPDFSNVKAAYLTAHGIALYSDETSTDQEYFIDNLFIVNPFDGLEFSTLEAAGTLSYMVVDGQPQTDVAAYRTYLLAMAGEQYLYVIGEKPQSELETPLADFADNESGIVIKGQNGQVIEDFYAKIRKTGKGDIQIITQKINANKVNSFDINAFTNFKSEQITDMGDGRVKVMIPLEDFGRENLKAFYYDQRGNVVYLNHTIEEIGGVEYVCFVTNHFSTYGIAIVNEAGSSSDAAGSSSDAAVDGKVSETGDTSGLTIWLALAAAALAIFSLFAKLSLAQENFRAEKSR